MKAGIVRGEAGTATVASGDFVHFTDISDGSTEKKTTVQNLLANGIGLDSTELGFLDGVVAGTAAASKALVLNSSSGISTITSATITTLTSTTANVPTVNTTNIDAGASGTAGSVDVFPSTASKGKTTITATDNSGNTTTTINTAAQAGSRTLTVPDGGQSTASFMLTEGAQTVNGAQTFSSTVAVTGALTSGTAKTDFQKFLGCSEADFINTVGTWTRTRVAQSDYVLRHTTADDTSVLGFEISPIIRTTASKGFRLDSIDVIYKITVGALDAHTATLDLVNYANNAARTVTSVPLTGSLSTATQANEYATNLTVTTPAFDVTADSKYVFELTVNNSASSVYDFIGLVLKYSRNDL